MNRDGSNRPGSTGKLFLPFVLDSRYLVFCFVLRGQSAEQQAYENPSVLDSSYHTPTTQRVGLSPRHSRNSSPSFGARIDSPTFSVYFSPPSNLARHAPPSSGCFGWCSALMHFKWVSFAMCRWPIISG